jgi:hypothetical protein
MCEGDIAHITELRNYQKIFLCNNMGRNIGEMLTQLLLSPWRSVRLEKLIVTQIFEVRFLYVTREFITVFNKVGRKFAA